MSPIQQGIQAAHAQTALMDKYILEQIRGRSGHAVIDVTAKIRMICDWAPEPVMICLNAGPMAGIQEAYDFLDSTNFNAYPYAKFHEDQDSLGGIITNAVILVPEKIYMAYDELIIGRKYNVKRIRGDNPYASATWRPNNMVEFYNFAYGGAGAEEGYSEWKNVTDNLKQYENAFGMLTEWDCQLIDFLRNYRLA